MKEREATFREKLYECDRHKEKILDAKEFLEELMPLDVEKYLNCSKIESSFIDQLIYRFTKLQDTLGESIFKGIIILSKENVKKMTFLDILNRLEELEIIDKNRWIALRDIRNEATHEYSFNQDEIVESINLVYKKSEELLEFYEKTKEFIKNRFDIC